MKQREKSAMTILQSEQSKLFREIITHKNDIKRVERQNLIKKKIFKRDKILKRLYLLQMQEQPNKQQIYTQNHIQQHGVQNIHDSQNQFLRDSWKHQNNPLIIKIKSQSQSQKNEQQNQQVLNNQIQGNIIQNQRIRHQYFQKAGNRYGRNNNDLKYRNMKALRMSDEDLNSLNQQKNKKQDIQQKSQRKLDEVSSITNNNEKRNLSDIYNCKQVDKKDIKSQKKQKSTSWVDQYHKILQIIQKQKDQNRKIRQSNNKFINKYSQRYHTQENNQSVAKSTHKIKQNLQTQHQQSLMNKQSQKQNSNCNLRVGQSDSSRKYRINSPKKKINTSINIYQKIKRKDDLPKLFRRKTAFNKCQYILKNKNLSNQQKLNQLIQFSNFVQQKITLDKQIRKFNLKTDSNLDNQYVDAIKAKISILSNVLN